MLVHICPVQGQHRGRPIKHMFIHTAIRVKQFEKSWASTEATFAWVSAARPGYGRLCSHTKLSIFHLDIVLLLCLFDFRAEVGFILLFRDAKRGAVGWLHLFIWMWCSKSKYFLLGGEICGMSLSLASQGWGSWAMHSWISRLLLPWAFFGKHTLNLKL